jgi:imidazole glycerol-phosphate synthase subunit HisH
MTTNSPSVAVVDYGMGNLGSVCNALSRLDASFFVARAPADLARADALIVPGVGAFGAAARNLRSAGLDSAMAREVLERGKPYLGICLGMQLLADDSAELGHHSGLAWIPGHVISLEESHRGVRVPHVGWNEVRGSGGAVDPLFEWIPSGTHFYFDHSFHLVLDGDCATATTDYGGSVVAAIRRGNIAGVQFHPEKSQRAGLRILRNFLNSIASFAEVGAA